MISHCHRSFYRIPTMPMTPGQPCSPRRIRCRERSAPLHFVSSRAHDQLRGRREAILSCTNQYLGEITGRMSLGFKIPRSTFFFGLKQRVSRSCFPLIYPKKTSPSFGKCRSRRAPRKKNSAVATEISSREGACSAKVAHVPWPRRIYAQTPNLPMKHLACEN